MQTQAWHLSWDLLHKADALVPTCQASLVDLNCSGQSVLKNSHETCQRSSEQRNWTYRCPGSPTRVSGMRGQDQMHRGTAVTLWLKDKLRELVSC